MSSKKTVFVTGTTGGMGSEVMKELLARNDTFNVVTLVRPSEKNRKLMAPYEKTPELMIVWGDLTHFDDVASCVRNADYVLHCAAITCPEADYHPDDAGRVNYGSAHHIVRAIKEHPNADRIRLVCIGTVAATGDRMPPIHWGRCGDPLKPSMYDYYATTKTAAEREVIESGLKHWVSLRQTGILTFDGGPADAIMYHHPLYACDEWVTARDSGTLLANICEDGVPADFWCRIYNIGGGPRMRTTCYEYLSGIFRLTGIDFREVVEPSWFVTRNFHMQWYEDSNVLEDYFHFQNHTFEDFLRIREQALPPNAKARTGVSTSTIKEKRFLPLAVSKNGPMYWIVNNLVKRINVFFGSKAKWTQIPGWDRFEYTKPSDKPQRLNHGYDETKPQSRLDLNDMKGAAELRGGRCLSTGMDAGDMKTKLMFQCAFGHVFEATPTAVLLGGHWCERCEAPPWNYDAIAKRNPFFAQVWYPLHDKDEDNYCDSRGCEDLL